MAEAYRKKIKRFYESRGAVRDMSGRPGLLPMIFSMRSKGTSALVRPGLVHSLISPAVKGKVLDVGIGGGPLAESLGKKKGVEVYGLDMSLPLLKKARKRKALPFLGAAEQLPFRQGTFNSVVSLDAFGHIENPARALREIRRVLKPGGSVVINVSEKGPYSEMTGGTGEMRFRSFEKGEIRGLFKRSGLRIYRTKTVGIVPLYPKNIFIYARKPGYAARRRRGLR